MRRSVARNPGGERQRAGRCGSVLYEPTAVDHAQVHESLVRMPTTGTGRNDGQCTSEPWTTSGQSAVKSASTQFFRLTRRLNGAWTGNATMLVPLLNAALA